MTTTATPRLDVAPRRALAPDTIIDGFRVTRLVAEGAMGEVYLAFDEQLGRRLALKFVKGATLDEKGLARFLEEARTTARFSHPNIVTVYAAGSYEGRPYLALEYLDGETLRARLDAGPLSPLEAMRLARAIAEALAEAHAHDVVHADLKPENVVLPKDGRARVVDFGLARLVGTTDAAVSGTPSYMSPERWQGAAPGPAIDVWAFGVMLHELIEGKRPFSERDLVQLAYAPRAVPLGPVAAAAPCAELIAACLAPRPNDRPTAAELVAKLSRLLEGRREVADDDRSPFRGLLAFTEADAADFHGRAAEVDAVVERLRTEGLVPIVGPSGVGKSSFIFAGVVPRLREAGAWEVLQLRPGRRPLLSLATALASATGEPVKAVLDALVQRPGALVSYLRRVHEARPARPRLVLVVDQFEEVVTLGDGDEARALSAALMTAASADEPWRVIVALRSDFLGAFAANAELRPALDAVTVLRPLTRVALEEAVSGPLKRVGYQPDDAGLPRRIAAELEAEPSALPLLQFACDALWQRRDTSRRLVLTREYEAMGGASGALATHAQRLVTELLPADRNHARALMLRLVNADGTRRPRTREELLQHLPAEAAAVLDRLLAERLLVSGRQGDGGEALVELAHEALVVTWPALSRWLAETQESRNLVADVEQAAALWEKRGRRDDETWAGDALADVLRRVENANISLPTLPRQFLEAAKVRAERQARRRRVGLVVAISVLAALALGATSAALAFREKERVAREQQREIRLAAADMGRFELVLEPFDWDAEGHRAVPASPAAVEGLDFRLHAVAPDGEPAEVYDSEYLVRGARVVGDGAVREQIEAKASAAWFEFTRPGCSSSWLFVRRLPGFRERREHQVVRIAVPTCQASQVGLVRVPGGEVALREEETPTFHRVAVGAFAIDRYEVTNEEFTRYAQLAPLTGDDVIAPPDSLVRGRTRLPVVLVTYQVAARFCRFMGKRLPSRDEWRKAARGGLTLDEQGTPNPMPERDSPWGEPRPSRANLATAAHSQLEPVGSMPGDRSPYGVFDLGGNVAEWTTTPTADGEWKGLLFTMGGDWAFSEATDLVLDAIDRGRPHTPQTPDLGTGFRCVADR